MNKVSGKACGTKAQGNVKPKKKPASKKWNYEKSIEKLRPIICQWHSVGTEILIALNEAYKQIKQHKRKSESWENYCAGLGLDSFETTKWLQTRRNLFEGIDQVEAELKKGRKK